MWPGPGRMAGGDSHPEGSLRADHCTGQRQGPLEEGVEAPPQTLKAGCPTPPQGPGGSGKRPRAVGGWEV